MSRSISRRIAQQIVDTVKDVCDHNINFINKDGVIFASTDAKRIGDFHQIGHTVYKTGETIEVKENDAFYGTHRGVNIPLMDNGKVIAVIGISGDPDDVRKYAYLAQKIASVLLKEQEVDEKINQRHLQINYLIRSLITGEEIDFDYFENIMETFHLDGNMKYTTIVVKLSSRYNPSNLSMIENNILQSFEDTKTKCYTFFYPNEYILILQSNLLPTYMYVFQSLSSKYQGLLKIGIGSSEILSKQELSYKSAKIALQSLNDARTLAVFDELDLEILLGSVSEDAKEQFLQKTIAGLQEKDLELLKCYFENEMSLKKTSDTLFLHKNTLQYQLNKIADKCGYNPRSFHDSVILYLSLNLLGKK